MGLENPLHIAILVVLILVVFGAKRLPEIGRSLGTGMREFKDSVSGGASGSSSTTTTQPAISQTTQQQPSAPVAQAPAAAPEQQPAPVVEPTHQP